MRSVFKISGMTCSNCSNSITDQLQSNELVRSAQVSLITEEAIVDHSNGISPMEIKEIIEDCGFDADILDSKDDDDNENDSPIINQVHEYTSKFKITGMTCSNCSNSISIMISPLVDSFDISLITEEAIVKHDASKITVKDIIDKIDDCGFDAELIESHPIENDTNNDDNDELESIISIKGMTCGACSSSITAALNQLDQVIDTNVSLITEQAKVKHSKSLDPSKLVESIDDCGFEAELIETKTILTSKPTNSTTIYLETTNFKILNNQEPNIQLINNFQGVETSKSLSKDLISITYDPQQTGIRTLLSNLSSINLTTSPQNSIDKNKQIESLQKLKEIEFWKWNFIKTGVIGLPLFLESHIFPFVFHIDLTYHLYHGIYLNSLVELILSAFIQFTVGHHFYKNAKNSIKHGSGTMDLLICISTNISFYFSIFSMIVSIIHNNTKMSPHTLFETSVLLMNFVSLGKMFESKAKSETSSSLSKLIGLTSSECTIVSDPTTFKSNKIEDLELEKIPINYLQINDIVEIKPGEKIPADGVIIKGESEIDESLLTGESLPIVKNLNDQVFGGSINGIGHLFIRVTTTSENSQLSKIIKLVKFAQMTKAPIQSYADFIASYFVPIILILSVLTFICWLIICSVNPPKLIANDINGNFFACLKIAISVIVVACPCALGLAAPTAIMVGTGVGAKHGVLIKSGEVLEIANDIDAIMFDKTGTLTVGEMNVQNFAITEHVYDDELIYELVASLESKSEHPIGKAIVNHVVEKQGFDKTHDVEDFKVIIGKGLSGNITVDGVLYQVKVGNSRMFPNVNSLTFDSDFTISYVSINDVNVGYIELQDTIKPDALRAISYLQTVGNYEIIMCTGDSTKTALKVAQQIGIPSKNVYSEISPYGKEQLVQDFQSNKGLKIAFVGDGINDSPALAKADLGIAIASGTDIAIEAADIVLINNNGNKKNGSGDKVDLKSVINALEISSKTLNRIKWNFFWSSVYNLTMVPIAMGILIPWGIQLSPLIAGLAMAFSSVSVVLSSLWLKRWRPVDLDAFVISDDRLDYDLEAGGDNLPRSSRFKTGFIQRLKAKLTRKPIENDIELQTGLLNN